MKTLLALLVLAGGALAQDPSNGKDTLTGKYEVTASPEGRAPMKLNAELKQEGSLLSGTVNSPIGSGPVKNSSIGSPDVTFQFMLGKHTFDVKGVAENGEIRGTFKGPLLMKGTFLAKRLDVVPTTQPVEGVEVGKLGEAGYRIDIPKQFNGGLILYCHGYSPLAGTFDRDKAPDALLKSFLDLGYAVAQSGYSSGGWAVKEGIEESEALRKYFAGKYGKPKRTFVTGHSMGGTITLALVELYPDAFDGALQMCGPLGPIQTIFQKRIFDTLVVYDYYFPGLIGSPVEISDEVGLDPEFLERVQKEAQAYPDRLSAFQKWSTLQSDVELAQIVAFYALVQKELMKRGGGNAFDNRNTLYYGGPDDALLNRGVKRYAAEPNAVEYLKKYYTPKAEPKQPILSLHTTYDPVVPVWSATAYGEMLRLNGGEGFFVQRFVSRNGHCTFTPQETIRAFQDLVTWKEEGKRPDSGEQK